MNDVDVVIPTWNGWPLLERCLPTVLNQGERVRVTVVDNGSTDGTVDHLRRTYEEVDVVALERNLGFAKAVNAGVAACRAPAVVLVNNDVELDPGFVAALVAPLDADARVGMSAALLLRPGRSAIDSYGIELDVTLAAYPRFVGAPYPETALHERFLAMPSGGAAGYLRAAYEQVGGFDEQLFAYMEDVDLGLRLAAAGWTAAGVREATGVHLGSASFGHRSRWQVEVAAASRAYLLRRYGVLGRPGANAARAVMTELGVVAADSLLARDLAAARGRARGWRLAGGRPRLAAPAGAVNPGLGVIESVRRRALAARPR